MLILPFPDANRIVASTRRRSVELATVENYAPAVRISTLFLYSFRDISISGFAKLYHYFRLSVAFEITAFAIQ